MRQKPKRILMTADTVGGVWTYAMDLAAALQQHGIAVALATMGARLDRDQRQQVARLSNVELFESSFKLEWMPEPWDDVERAGDWLLEIAAGVQPNLIHLNNFAHGALPWGVPALMVGHSCVLSWFEAVKGCEATPGWSRYAAEVRSGLQAADMVVAPTRAMLQKLEKFYGPFPCSRVIFNGRNPELFKSTPKENVIFTAGRVWDEAKNVSRLIEVADEIPWRVFVAGEAKPNSAADKVHLLGRLSEAHVADWLDRAAIYAAPALYEPFGLSILEAALAGCALVLGDIPSLQEIWNDVAVFVPPRDSRALKAALIGLIKNPGARLEWAARAQCRAIQFNPECMVAEYLAAYNEILTPKGAADSHLRRVCADTDVLSYGLV